MNEGLLALSLFGFVVFGSVNSIIGWRPFRIEYLNFTAHSLSESIDFNVTFNQNDEISVYVNLKENALHPFAKIEFYVDSGDGLFDMKLINETFDICRFFRDKRYLPIIQIIYKSFGEQTNFPRSCPIKKNLYIGKNMKMDIEKLPPTLPNKQMYIATTLMSKEGSKLKPVCFYKSVVQIKNV